jgi:hypothetical protein
MVQKSVDLGEMKRIVTVRGECEKKVRRKYAGGRLSPFTPHLVLRVTPAGEKGSSRCLARVSNGKTTLKQIYILGTEFIL